MTSYAGTQIVNSSATNNGQFGSTVSNIGDFNGDGFDDFLVAEQRSDYISYPASGSAYVVFGSDAPPAVLDVATLDGDNGFEITVHDSYSESGVGYAQAAILAAGVGDVNGDGFADIAVGSSRYGEVTVLYGTDSDVGATVDTRDVRAPYSGYSGYSGYVYGAKVYGFSGAITEIEALGDVNGDGYDDFAVTQADINYDNFSDAKETAVDQYYNGYSYSGSGYSYGDNPTVAYIVLGEEELGSTDVYSAGDDEVIEVLGVAGSVGVGRAEQYGSAEFGSYAFAAKGSFEIEALGDINGDGFDDFALRQAQATKFVTQGYGYYGYSGYGYSGYGYSGYGYSSYQTEVSKTAAVIFGDGEGGADEGQIELPAPYYGDSSTVYWSGHTGSYSFSGGYGGGYYGPYGEYGPGVYVGNYYLGSENQIAGIGDFNGDGYTDVALSQPYLRSDGTLSPGNGAVFIIFGGEDGLDFSGEDGLPVGVYDSGDADIVLFDSSSAYDSDREPGRFGRTIAAAGDVNGDGYADVLVASESYASSGNYSSNGFVYLVFGYDPADVPPVAGPAPVGPLGVTGPDDAGVVDLADDADGLTGNGYLFNGLNLDRFDRGTSDYTSNSFWLEKAGDVDDDGNDDFLLGISPYSGQDRVYLVLGGSEALEAADNADGTDDNVISVQNLAVDLDTGVAPINVSFVGASGFGDYGASGFEGTSDDDDPARTITFTLFRSGDLTEAVSVDFAVTSGSPGSGNLADAADFVGGVFPSGTVSFAAGNATTQIEIAIAGDDVQEASEAFQIQLSNLILPAGESGGFVPAGGGSYGIIFNDDFQPSVFANNDFVEEGEGPLEFRVDRFGDTSEDVVVDYVIRGYRYGDGYYGPAFAANGGPQQAGSGYYSGSGYAYSSADSDDIVGDLPIYGQVTIYSGQSSGYVELGVEDDNEREYNDERLTFEILGAESAGGDDVLVQRARGVGTIADNDEPPFVFANSVSATEGTDSSFDLVFSRSGRTDVDVTAEFQLRNTGLFTSSVATSADIGGQALPLNGSVFFAVGETEARVSIDLTDDQIVEGTEYLEYEITGASSSDTAISVNFSTSDRFVTIFDDASIFDVSSVGNVTEADGAFLTFTVTRSGDSTSDATVTYDLLPSPFSTALQVSSDDIVGTLPLLNQQIVFAAGETSKTVSVEVVDDDLVESTEYLRMQLTGATSDDGNIETGLAAFATADDAAIINDDQRADVFVNVSNGNEDGGQLSVTFQRNDFIFSSSDKTVVEIDYEIVGDTFNAASSDDIVGTLPLTGTITLDSTEISETIFITPIDDQDDEGNEQLIARITEVRAVDGVTPVNITDAEDTLLIIDDDAPIRFTASNAFVNEDDGSALIGIFRSGRTDVAASIDVVIDQNGVLTTADDADVVGTLPIIRTVNFAALDTFEQISLGIFDDEVIEGTEYLSFSLGNPTSTDDDANFEVSADTYRIEIEDDDRAVEINASNASASEDAGQITFTVTRSGNTAEAATIDYNIVATPFSSTAESDDLVGGLPQSGGTLSFASGVTSQTITVDIVDDGLVETNEQFYLNLLGGTTGNPNVFVDIQTAQVTGTIFNDDIAVQIAVSDATTTEGAGSPLSFTFTRSGNTQPAVQVDYEVQPTFSTADADDFVDGFPTLTGTVNFAAGETTTTVSFDVSDDIEVEADETLQLRVTNVDAGPDVSTSIIDGTGLGTIVNDDFFVELSVDAASGAEDGGPITVTIRRTGDTDGVVTANYLVTSSQASPATQADVIEALPLSGSVVFNAGETAKTFQITPVDDALVEGSEYLEVTLTGASSTDASDVIIRQTFPSFVEIRNDDQNVEISVRGETRDEDDGEIRLFVDRSGDTTKEVTVDYTIASFDTEADDLSTLLPSSGSVTFAAGETTKTLTVNVVPDTDVEPDEFIQIALTDAQLSGADAGDDTPVIFQTFPAFSRIRNDDIPVTFSVSSAATVEGGNLAYTITRNGPTTTTAMLDWDFVANSYATAETEDLTDGLPQSGTLTFNPGTVTQNLIFGTTEDTLVEGTEYTRLNFSNATSDGPTGAVAPTGRTGTIYDNNIIVRGRNDSILEDDGPLIFDVFRSGVTSAAVTVDYTISSYLGRTSDDDIAGSFDITGQVTFAANETQKSIILDVTADDEIEGTELVQIDFTGASTPLDAFGIDLQNYSSFGYIYNDDFEIELSLRAFSANEGEDLVYYIYRSGDTDSDVTVDYEFDAGGTDPAETAVGDDLVDGLPQAGSVTFASGETFKLLTIASAEDDDIESNEGVTLEITDATTTGSNTIAIGGPKTGYILNDDFPVTFRAWGTSGYEDSGLLTFTVQRSGNTAVAASIDYTIPNTGGTFYAGADDITGGLPQTGTLDFLAGETIKTINLLPVADTTQENSELVQLSLGNAVVPSSTVASIQSFPASAYIYNDDLPPAIQVSGGRTVSEGNSGVSPVTFTLLRTGDLTDTTTVDYGISGGNADNQDVSGSLPDTGAVVFAPGETTKTVTVNVVGDRIIEPNESFSFRVENIASSDARVYTLSGGTQTVSIRNDDGRPPLLPPGIEADVFGDPHIVTLDGLTYSFMAVGEYVLLESLPGESDPFQVQVRFEPAPGSNLVSVTTRMAVEVDGKVVELSALDGGKLLVDGAETVIDPELGAIDINGDDVPDIFLQLDADGNAMYTIVLNGTNEQLKIGMFEGYMNVCVFLAEGRAGNVRGLMGNADGDTDNDLALRSGTVLDQPPAFDALYGDFANSWRVEDPATSGTEMASLFTYGSGEDTTSFDDPNFPAADVSLDDIPADLLARAEAAADEAGITDPILREAAILDFAFTGDESFLTGATNLAAEPETKIEVESSGQEQITLNVTAETREITEDDTGKTTVQFTFYRTGDSTEAITVDYEIAGTVDAADLDVGTPLSGTVVIEAGETETVLNVAVLGDLTTELDENLDVKITGTGDGIVGAATARTVIVTDDFGPAAVDDTFGVSVGATLEGNVLAPNPTDADSDLDNDTLSVTKLDGGGLVGSTATVLLDFGSVTVTETGELTYTTDARADVLSPGDVESESFTYTISDGNGGTDQATAEISVIAPSEIAPPDNTVPGTAGTDALEGTDGNDVIDAGGGLFDTLTGGAGGDTFVFTDTEGVQDYMTITDFDAAEDSIDLQGIDYDSAFSFGGATYLYLNGTEYDLIVVNGANAVDDINFI